ncbi:class I SAM-dependent methyltransferase [Lysinibacillus sp. NPDC097279]|uniref:class I SAM-dependent methyltransferase n=1 Tax=Lysinibacillus sp. NPDC097279 TaxID=3364143 RepID=UPI003828D8DD
MKCSLCNSVQIKTRYPYVRDNKEIEVLECEECGLVFLSTIQHISDKFYEDSGMLNGIVNLKEYRLQSFKDDERRALDLRERIIGKQVLDFGCGAGGFLNLIKDFTGDVAGVELDKKINRALNEEGIYCYSNIDEIEGTFDVITLFHVLEHLTNPKEMLENLKKYLKPNGTIIIEVPNADDALLTLYKSTAFSDFTYWSCHVYLYNSHTLNKLVDNCGYNVKLVKQIQRYPISNHLYWLSENKPGGHKIFNLIDNQILNKEYENALAAIGKCDTILLEATLY